MQRIAQKYGRWLWFVLGSAAGCGGDSVSERNGPGMAASQAGAEAGAGAAASGSGGGGGTAGAGTYSAGASWCDVKRTLDTRCVICHDERHTAGSPMPLLTYAQTQAPAVSDASRKVYQLMGVRVHDARNPMPPQQQLTAAELATIDDWIAAGAPAAEDPTCGAAPPVVSGPDAWPTNCDAKYTILAHAPGSDTQPYQVGAGKELHPNITVPAPWGSDALQGIAFRPITDNRKIVHHWILYGPKHEFLTGWAPGKDNTVLPPDVGMNLSGGTLTLNMHYNNTLGTQAEQDRSGVEVCALDPANFRKHTAAVHTGFSALGFTIPAHATGFDVTGQCTATVSAPVTLFSASPHAHTLAQHMKFSVLKASGESIVMFDGSFNFDEQQAYALNPMVQLGSGDKVITTCTYDNTTDRAVSFGQDTSDEMCFNFAAYYPMGALTCGFAL